VLATLEELQKIERGILAIQSWWLRVESSFTKETIFEGAKTIACVYGCDIAMTRTLMNHLPGILQFPLYIHQA
jgi:hypothetical protein